MGWLHVPDLVVRSCTISVIVLKDCCGDSDHHIVGLYSSNVVTLKLRLDR